MAAHAPRPELGLAHPTDDISGFWSLGLADQVATRLRDRVAFEDAVARLSALLAELGCMHVTGLSPMGERLAQAVVAASPTAMGHGTGDVGRVAFVDSVINTGVNLVAAMRDARATGARDVVGVALVAQGVAISAWAAEGEILRAVEEV
jgi:hypothetical protein